MKKNILTILLLLPLYVYSQNYTKEIDKLMQDGDDQYGIFIKECDKANMDGLMGKADEEIMYDAISKAYRIYNQADMLAQKAEDNGKGANLYVDSISSRLLAMKPYFVNAGLYYNEKKEYLKASEYFETYWNYQLLRIFKDSRSRQLETTEQDSAIKYYAIICAIQADNSDLSIALLQRLIAEPYIKNDTYKESDPYELLAYEYQKSGKDDLFIESLKFSSNKFPDNIYFTSNLVNEYIKGSRMDDAISLLDKMIGLHPESSEMYLFTKANIYAQASDFANAEKSYNAILKKDKNSIKAAEGLGVMYVLMAQLTKDEAENKGFKGEELEKANKEVCNLYEKSVPFLEKYYSLLSNDQSRDSSEIKRSLTYLQNVYYNLSLSGIDRGDDFERIEKLLEQYY